MCRMLLCQALLTLVCLMASVAVGAQPPDPDRAGASEGGATAVDAAASTDVVESTEPVAGTLEMPPDPVPVARDPAPPPRASPRGARPVVSIQRVTEAPRIDGQLDDAAWAAAARVTEFVQERPLDRAPATEATEVSIAYDSQYIYLGVYAHYSDTALIRANRADRDQISRDDTVTVTFDPFQDAQRGYSFSVNGYGVQADALVSNQGGPLGGVVPGGGGGAGARFSPIDPSWDALFHSAGHIVEDGWVAEIAIPFKSLRYPARGRGKAHRWGFQIQREIQSKNESVVWAPISRDVMGFLAQMGVLGGFSDLSTSRNLEVLPTVTAVANKALDTNTGLHKPTDIEEGGLSVKYGITPNMTLDFTYNPDFSQIESDTQQISVNQRFPLFYPELRPFFIEGQEIFNIPGPVTLVHTRTIVDPRFGAKVTGKVGKTTVGFLVANDQAPGHVEDSSDPAFGQTAQVVVGRVRYDMKAESSLGLIFTDREFMDQYSRVGGFDGVLRFGRNQRLVFRTMRTAHRDATGVETEGQMFDAALRKEGRHLGFVAAYFTVSPHFKTDTGFVRRTDQRELNTQLQYRWWPKKAIVNWGPRIQYNHNRQFNGTLQDHGGSAGVQAQFAKNIFVTTSVERDMERYLDVNFQKRRVGVGGNINTSRKISIGGYINRGDQIRFIEQPYLGTGDNAQLFVTARPFSRFQSNLILTRSNFVNVSGVEEFDINVYRVQTTYQFTGRLLLRSILEYNDYDGTFGSNVLATYRVNSGTAFYIGYDDRYRQGRKISETLFPSDAYQPVNRAFFAKLQVLFRY